MLSLVIRVWGNAGSNRPRCQTPTDVQPNPFPQPSVTNGQISQRCVAGGQLGDLQSPEVTDHVHRAKTRTDTVGQVLAKTNLERQHVRAATQLQDVRRVLVIDNADDRDVTGRFTNRQRDIGVRRVLAVGKQ